MIITYSLEYTFLRIFILLFARIKKTSEQKEEERKIKAQIKEIVKIELRKPVDAQNNGRSGNHGTRYIKLGNYLIQLSNNFNKSSHEKELYQKEGNQYINRGKSINHKV